MEKITTTQRFWRLLKPDEKEIRHVYLYGMFNGFVGLSLPIGIQAIINLIQGGQISTSWIILVIFVVCGVALTGLLQILQLRITENLQQRIFTRAAFEFAYRLPKMKLEVLYKHHAPELMNRFFDIIAVQKGLSKLLIEFFTAALSVIFGLLLLSFYHSFFILFSVVLVFLIIVLIRYTAGKGMNSSLKESKYKYKVAHWLEELARTATTFKLAGKTELPLEKTDVEVTEYLKAREVHFKVLVQQYSLLVLFKVCVATGLLAIGGILVMEQHMNIGQFVAAEIIILLVMSSVEKLVLSLETIYDVLTALEKIGQVTDMDLETLEGIDLTEHQKPDGMELILENVSFSYPENIKRNLTKVSLNVESGETVVVTGPSGSGKSTLLQIIAGMYEVQEGSISYNGLPKGNLELSALRSSIGDFLTNEQIFEGTLLENITMGRPEATFENVKWAVDKMQLTNFVRNQPKGYNTEIEPQGKRFSKTEVLKILLARSIADRPKLVLMEDAFESFPKIEQDRIVDFLTDHQNNWTLVISSDDPYLISKADKVVHMRGGSIEKIEINNNLSK